MLKEIIEKCKPWVSLRWGCHQNHGCQPKLGLGLFDINNRLTIPITWRLSIRWTSLNKLSRLNCSPRPILNEFYLTDSSIAIWLKQWIDDENCHDRSFVVNYLLCWRQAIFAWLLSKPRQTIFPLTAANTLSRMILHCDERPLVRIACTTWAWFRVWTTC